MRFKKTEICQTCSKLKNVCQTCLLDLEFGSLSLFVFGDLHEHSSSLQVYRFRFETKRCRSLIPSPKVK